MSKKDRQSASLEGQARQALRLAKTAIRGWKDERAQVAALKQQAQTAAPPVVGPHLAQHRQMIASGQKYLAANYYQQFAQRIEAEKDLEKRGGK
jgi:hypothetical protein